MAETAVGTVIDKLIPLLRDEATLLRGVHSQVTFVKDQLALIQAYLKDADVKAETSDLAEEWVKQVREVAYRMQDVIDEYLVRVATGHQRDGAVGVVCKIAFLLRSIIPWHEITSEIGDIRESIVRLNQVKETLGFNPVAPEARSDGVGISTRHDLRWGSHFFEDDQLVGVDHTRNLLTGWLSNVESGRTVFSVVGEGGLGKTIV